MFLLLCCPSHCKFFWKEVKNKVMIKEITFTSFLFCYSGQASDHGLETMNALFLLIFHLLFHLFSLYNSLHFFPSFSPSSSVSNSCSQSSLNVLTSSNSPPFPSNSPNSSPPPPSFSLSL